MEKDSSEKTINIIKKKNFKFPQWFLLSNCFHSSETGKKLESYHKECENKDFWKVIMSSKDYKILEFDQNQKYDTAYKCLIENINACKKNPEQFITTKVGKHIAPGFSRFLILSFKSMQNKSIMYKRGKDFMKKFESLKKDNTMEIINFEMKNEFINKKTAVMA